MFCQQLWKPRRAHCPPSNLKNRNHSRQGNFRDQRYGIKDENRISARQQRNIFHCALSESHLGPTRTGHVVGISESIQRGTGKRSYLMASPPRRLPPQLLHLLFFILFCCWFAILKADRNEFLLTSDDIQSIAHAQVPIQIAPVTGHETVCCYHWLSHFHCDFGIPKVFSWEVSRIWNRQFSRFLF